MPLVGAGHGRDRRAEQFAQGWQVRQGGQVGVVDRHGMHVAGRDGRPCEERLLESGQVAFGPAGRRDPLVDLEDVHVLPGQLPDGQFGEERLRATAAAHCQRCPAPGIDRLGQPCLHQVGGPGCQRRRVHEELHIDVAHRRIMPPAAGLTWI